MSPPDQHDVEAMGPREVIGQAVELLCERHGVTRAAAFEMLVRGSSDSQDQVRDAAAVIVHRLAD